MKSLNDIRNDLLELCADYGVTISDTVLDMIALYVSHEILNARQDVFDMVIAQIEKRGVRYE